MAPEGAPVTPRIPQAGPADARPATRLPKVHLVEGPVGAGKSTFASALAGRIGGVHLALDAWFAQLFSPDRPSGDVMPWYVERKARLLDRLWHHALALREAGVAPVLELGLVQRHSREDVYARARDAGVELVPYVLVASREVRRERVARRNVEQGPTFSMVVPDAFFERASDAWEEPDELELVEHGYERIVTDAGA